MTQITSLEQARKIFPDAEMIKLINPVAGHLSPLTIRRLTAPEFCIVSLAIDDGNAVIIVSEEARRVSFPDATLPYQTIRYGRDSKALVGYTNGFLQVTFLRSLHRDRRLFHFLDCKLGKHLYRVSYYDDADMSSILVKDLSFQDVSDILSSFKPTKDYIPPMLSTK